MSLRAAADAASQELRLLRPPEVCGTEMEQVPWVGTVVVRLDDERAVGVRFDHGELLDAVVVGLGDRVVGVSSDGDVPAYYSVRLSPPTRRRRTPLHYVYRGGRAVVGTRDVARLLSGLEGRLASHLEPDPEHLLAQACPLLTPAGVLLVPEHLAAVSKIVDRVLRPDGFTTADTTLARLEPATGRVVVPEPGLRLAVEHAVVAGLAESLDEPRLEPGTYPLAGWLVSTATEDAGPLRPAKALLHAVATLRRPYPRGAQDALETVAAVVGQTSVTGLSWSSDEELVAQVHDAGLVSAG